MNLCICFDRGSQIPVEGLRPGRAKLYLNVRAGCRKGRKNLARSLIFLLFFIVLLIPGPVSRVQAAESGQGQWVLEQIEHRNKAINDFTADLNITLYAFLMKFPLQAKLFFKKPNKVRLSFRNMPDFLKSYKNTFKAIIPTETLSRNYRSTLGGKEAIQGRECYALTLTPRGQGNVKEVRLWADTATFMPLKLIFTYRAGGTVQVENSYASQGGVLLPDRQKILFNLPELRARGWIRYHNHRINQGLDDSLFDKNVRPPRDK
jgi:outer membrane lipoprotein-sorting protein